jgi:hypothetical protein
MNFELKSVFTQKQIFIENNKFISKETHFISSEGLLIITVDRTSYNIYPSDKSHHLKKILDDYDISLNKEIHCKVLTDKSIYINSQGVVIPCCWLDTHFMYPNHKSKIDILDRNIKFLSLVEYSLSDIFESGIFDKISDSWKSNPLEECSKQCGKIDKFNLQY